MYIVVDTRIPEAALKKLSALGELIPFVSKNITYDSISGHPDVFVCKTPEGLIIAPNTPAEVTATFRNLPIKFATGEKPLGNKYPESTSYNAFVNDRYFIHHLNHSDSLLRDNCKYLKHIHVNQAYTRCNLVEAGGLYITSDEGIKNTLKQHKLDILYIDPRQIKLPGHDHGFFGGCAGTHNNSLYLIGSCSHFDQGIELKTALSERNINLVELYHGPLWDGGSILFLDPTILP